MLVLLCAPMVHGFAMRPMHGARSAPKPLLARRALMASGPAALLGELQVPPPPEAVVAAVEKIGSNQRVIAADVAAKGGMDLNTAARGLNELASALAGADGLSVAASSSGDLVYSFPENVRGELSSRSASAKARETWDAAKPALITAGRVSFGLALIASIVVVYAAIVAIQTSSDEDDRRDDRRGGGMMGGFGGGGWGYNPFWSPLDLFWPRHAPTATPPTRARTLKPQAQASASASASHPLTLFTSPSPSPSPQASPAPSPARAP